MSKNQLYANGSGTSLTRAHSHSSTNLSQSGYLSSRETSREDLTKPAPPSLPPPRLGRQQPQFVSNQSGMTVPSVHFDDDIDRLKSGTFDGGNRPPQTNPFYVSINNSNPYYYAPLPTSANNANKSTLKRSTSLMLSPVPALTFKERVEQRWLTCYALTYKKCITQYKSFFDFLKYACSVTSVITVLVCYGVGMALGETFASYPVPYLSYIGGELPQQFFFILGLSMAALMYLPVLFLNQSGMIFLHIRSRSVMRLAVAGFFLGFFAAACLVLLSIFSVYTHDTIHYSFAFSFFLLATLWALLDFFDHILWYQDDKRNKPLKHLIILKGIVLSCLIIVFSIFAGTTLGMDCNLLMDINGYENCPVTYTISAISQYLTLAFIMLYISCLQYTEYRNSTLVIGDVEELIKMKRKRNKYVKPMKKGAPPNHGNGILGNNNGGQGGGSFRNNTNPSTVEVTFKVEDLVDNPSSNGNLRVDVPQVTVDVDDFPLAQPSSRSSLDQGPNARRRSVDSNTTTGSQPNPPLGSSSRRPSASSGSKGNNTSNGGGSDDQLLPHKGRSMSVSSKPGHYPSSSTRSNRSNLYLETQFEEDHGYRSSDYGYRSSDQEQNLPSSGASSLRKPRAGSKSSSKRTYERQNSKSSLDIHTPLEPSAPSFNDVSIPNPTALSRRRASLENTRQQYGNNGSQGNLDYQRPVIDMFFDVKPF